MSNSQENNEFDSAHPAVSGINNRPQHPSSSKFSQVFSDLKKSKHYQRAIDELKEVEKGPQEARRLIAPGKTNAIIVNSKQRGNPILKHICNVPYEFGEIIPDYVMGNTICALFLSCRYHGVHPQYIHERLKELGKNYELRILLVQVDSKDPHHVIKDLTKIAMLANCTLLLAWSAEEAGKYLETYKSFENKPPEMIMKRQDDSNYCKIIDALTSIKSINKSDAAMLLSKFGTLENIMNTTKEDLCFCPGMGYQKASRLFDALHGTFLATAQNQPITFK